MAQPETNIVSIKTRRRSAPKTPEAKACDDIRKLYRKLCDAIDHARRDLKLDVKVYLDSSDTYGHNLVRGKEIIITKKL